MNSTTRQAFVATIPVMTGYLALGFGFGIMLKASGFPVWLAPVISYVPVGTQNSARQGLGKCRFDDERPIMPTHKNSLFLAKIYANRESNSRFA